MAKRTIVTAQEFILNVADRLKARREHLGWTVMDVQAKGGPNYHTVQKIELGHVAAPDIMEKHITALGLTLRDVYTAALTPPGHDEPFSHAASEVARVYDQATPEGQEALRALARALDQPGRRRRLAGREAVFTSRGNPRISCNFARRYWGFLHISRKVGTALNVSRYVGGSTQGNHERSFSLAPSP